MTLATKGWAMRTRLFGAVFLAAAALTHPSLSYVQAQKEAATEGSKQELGTGFSPAELAAIENGGGVASADFVLCPALPDSQWGPISGAAKRCGLRPVRLRPCVTKDGLRLSCLWTKNGSGEIAEWGLTKAAFLAAHEERAKKKFRLVDLASYGTVDPDGHPLILHAGVWAARTAADGPQELYLEVPDREHAATYTALKNRNYMLVVLQTAASGGQLYVSGLWELSAYEWQFKFGRIDQYMQKERELREKMVQVDVGNSALPLVDIKTYSRERVAAETRRIEQHAQDWKAYYNRGFARLVLGDDEGTIRDLTAAIDHDPQTARFWGPFLRGLAAARRGDREAAEVDRVPIAASGDRENLLAFDLMTRAYLGDLAGTIAALEAAEKSDSKPLPLTTARIRAVLAQIAMPQAPDLADELVVKMVHAMEIVPYSFTSRFGWFEPQGVLDHPRVREFRHRHNLDCKCAGVWYLSSDVEARGIFGVPAEEHREMAAELLQSGWTPVSRSIFCVPVEEHRDAAAELLKSGWTPVSVACVETDPKHAPRLTSLWQRRSSEEFISAAEPARRARLEERDRSWIRALEAQNEGKYAEAIEQARDVIAIESELYGSDSPKLLIGLRLIADCAEALEDWAAAELERDKSLGIAEKEYGKEHWTTINARLARQHLDRLKSLPAGDRESLRQAARDGREEARQFRAGDYAGAEKIALRVRSVRERILGPDDPQTATSVNNLAGDYARQNNYSEAEPLYKRALAIRENALGLNHPSTADTLNHLADLYQTKGNYASAEPLYERALEFYERARGPNDRDATQCLKQLAYSHMAQGKYGTAEPLYARALQIDEAVKGPNHRDTAKTLESLAYSYLGQAKYGAAEPLYARALSIWANAGVTDQVETVNALIFLAYAYQAQGKYRDAEPLYKRGLAILDKADRPPDRSTAVGLAYLASLHIARGNYLAAEPLCERGLKFSELASGLEHPDTAVAASYLSEVYRALGRYTDAEILCQRALKIYENSLGAEHPFTATGLNNLALVYQAQANYPAAEPLYRRSLTIIERSLGPDHPSTATSLNNLAWCYQALGKYDLAEPLYQRAVQVIEKNLGPDHPTLAMALDNLALLYLDEANYAAAEPVFQRALKISEDFSGPEHPNTATILAGLASLHQVQGNYGAAEPLYKRSLSIQLKVLGSEHPQTATSMDQLASLYHVQGSYAAAEPLYRQSLTIREKALGPEHPDMTADLVGLASLYQAQGNHGAAEPLYERALRIREKALGQEHPQTAAALVSLAILYQAQGKHATAEPLYERAMKIREKILGPEHPDTGASLIGLASLYQAQQRYTAAEPLLERSLRIMERALGAEHPSTGTTLQYLASLYSAEGKYVAAEPLCRRALTICETALGAQHPDTSACLNNLAFLEWVLDRRDEAGRLVARGLDVQLAHLDRTAAIQTEQQQMLMVQTAGHHLSLWLTMTAEDRQVTSDAWRYALLWKGLTTTRQLRLRRGLKGDAIYADFRRVSQQLSTLTLNPPRPPSAPNAQSDWQSRAPELRRQWDERRAALEEEYEQLEKELAQKSAFFNQDLRRQELTAKDVRAALSTAPSATALVDTMQYWHYGKAGNTSEWRLAAFVVRADRDVERVELGSVERIWKQVTAWRENYGRAQEAGSPGAELRGLLWEPLVGHLDGIDVILVSPDGALAQLPWGALPGEKPGTFLIEERALAIIPVPQLAPELLERQVSPRIPQSLLLAGQIEYGGDAGAPQDLLAKREAIGRVPDGKLFAFPEITAAQSELASVKDYYVEALKSQKRLPDEKNPKVLRKTEATESAFREQAGQHQWLHVITHGFFAPETIESSLRVVPDDKVLPLSARPTAFADSPSGGIGAALEVKDGRCLVTALVAGGAAEADGRLKVQDEVLAVASREGDWIAVDGKPLADVVALIRGPAGTVVRLKVRRTEPAEDSTELVLTRRALPAPAKPPPVHPGLLSGLAFAGANSPAEPDKDDGILTALEVESLDLTGVDTVVLSACETGLGQVAGGEGLLGLQRAFQVAGAKSVVASLWKVPDSATARLMQRFYENLWEKKMGKLEALREAQIWMLRDKGNRGLALPKDAPKDDEPLPPYYWAAFVLSGDWR
jgi:CHAT domain-containing protein/Tfp pilus assembly protein PilF